MEHLNAAADFILLLGLILLVLAIAAGAVWWGYDTVERMFDDWKGERYDFRSLDMSSVEPGNEHEVGPLPR